MSQIEATPALPDYSSSPPPNYNANAAVTEQVLASTAFGDGSSPPPSLAGHTISNTSTVHSNEHILVILPRPGRTSSTRTGPSSFAYGRKGTISGLVSLAPGKWTSTISKVAVSLTGHASSVLIRQGMQEPATSRKLFSTSQVLWSSTSNNSRNSPDKPIKFELQFPESIPDGQKGHIDLPPTFDEKTQTVFGIAAHVKIEYKLTVDVRRRGLWSNRRYVHVQ